MWPLILATPAVFEVMNQFTPRHSVDTMARLYPMADMHMHTAGPTAMWEALLGYIQEHFLNQYLPGHRMFANLHRRLRITYCSWGGRSVLFPWQSSCQHPSCSTWLRNTKPRRLMACSQGQWSTSLPFSESAVCTMVPDARTGRLILLKYVLFTDESCFTHAGTFNPHNFHDWQQDNPM